jgi:hypothetical protein
LRRSRSSVFIQYPLLLAYSIAQPVAAYILVLISYSSFKRSKYLLEEYQYASGCRVLPSPLGRRRGEEP